MVGVLGSGGRDIEGGLDNAARRQQLCSSRRIYFIATETSKPLVVGKSSGGRQGAEGDRVESSVLKKAGDQGPVRM